MQDSIKHIADEVKSKLIQDVESGRWLLVNFARDYAYKEHLRYEAILLNMNFSKANSENKRTALQEDMLALVDGIYESYGIDEKKIKIAQQTRELLNQELNNVQKAGALVVSCKNLGFKYKKDGFELKDINIEIYSGEVLGVLGKNGEGKTTLLKLLASELFPTEGQISFPSFHHSQKSNRDWLKIKNQIAYVPQELNKWYGSLVANIRYAASIHGIRGDDNIRDTNFIIHRLGLSEHLDKKWDNLSGGFKFRFALARALVWKPKLLVLDEPLANLDLDSQQMVLFDLRNLAKSIRYPITVVISSQHLYEVESISDQLIYLKNNRPAFYGNMESIKGVLNDSNVFELECDLELNEIKDLFPNYKISFNGTFYVLTSPPNKQSDEVLLILLKAGIQVKYFRDISDSVKRLFD